MNKIIKSGKNHFLCAFANITLLLYFKNQFLLPSDRFFNNVLIYYWQTHIKNASRHSCFYC